MIVTIFTLNIRDHSKPGTQGDINTGTQLTRVYHIMQGIWQVSKRKIQVQKAPPIILIQPAELQMRSFQCLNNQVDSGQFRNKAKHQLSDFISTEKNTATTFKCTT
jgi:hypothetical protein